MDKTNFQNFKDENKKNFMENFVFPVGLAMLSETHLVKSNKIIPTFDGKAAHCDDNGKLTIPEKYKSETTKGDYLIFVGVENNEEADYIAYAFPCIQGNSISLD